jgi:hypothetical protein
MIYVDEVNYWPGKVTAPAQRHGRLWCHLWCDAGDEEVLHGLAKKIGLKREWYQQRARFNHYDLVPSKRGLAIQAGAKPVPLGKWLWERKKQGKGKSG